MQDLAKMAAKKKQQQQNTDTDKTKKGRAAQGDTFVLEQTRWNGIEGEIEGQGNKGRVRKRERGGKVKLRRGEKVRLINITPHYT